MPDKLITKEYVDKIFHEFRGDMHVMTKTATANMEAFYETESKRALGALKEGFTEQVQIALDQVKSLTDYKDNHEVRLCKVEEMCYK